ncbi:hypothetical protein EDC96DRAFT_504067 [Choanephora cucurbitarum]|nr:hypothetical protein EDC96DRAFT_504067 [Choanephora cucurbitarum]
MDLNSLLNDQNDNTITLSVLKNLLEQNDSAKTLDKIRASTTYIYPDNEDDSFAFFDYFIRVILSALTEDDPYSAQYARSIIIDSLRTCLKGLTERSGTIWLTRFPHHFTRSTWTALHDNIIVLAYLYGLVLALLKEPDMNQELWCSGFLQFMRSDVPVVLCHLWLYCCTYLDDQGDTQQFFLQCLENCLQQQTVSTFTVIDMLTIMKEGQADFVLAQMDAYWGAGLIRPPFTVDEIKLGFICFRDSCKRQSYQYHAIAKAFSSFDVQSAHIKSKQNKLLHPDLLAPIPADKFAQTKAIQKSICFWIEQMSTMLPNQFDFLLKSAILDHYPTDRKSVLDLVIANWTLHDRFHRHMELVIETMLSQFETKKYNIRISPYYAFVQLFSLSQNQLAEDHQQQDQQQQQNGPISFLDYNATTYQVKSGAYIDLSHFSNYSDTALVQGCCSLLQKITLSVANTNHHQAHEWLADCLKSADANIVRSYAAWLANGLEKDLQQSKNSVSSGYAEFMLTLLATCVARSTHIVPTLLFVFSDRGLAWLLKSNRSSATILLHYFDDGSQVSKDMVVTDLLKTKSKQFIDMLLGYLRENMAGIDPKAPHSRVWFQNHFLRNILSLVGEEDQVDTSVASQLFRQFFKTRDDFEWYFGTPLLQQITFNSLDLANVHDIYAVKSTGLAAMFQEMVRLGDHVKKERLMQIWSDLWIANQAFTVPVSWVLQCAGLYDQAPVLVKQMIKRFVAIGLQPQQPQSSMTPLLSERKFLDRMMDLVLLSDAPEPDSLFELILEIACENDGLSSAFEQINWNIINILIELAEELELELKASTDMTPLVLNKAEKKRSKKQLRKLRRGGKLSHNKLRSMMRKHEEELERYLKESSSQSLKALTTLVQRLFNFLLRLLNTSLSKTSVDSNNNSLAIKQDIQKQLMSTPLFYEPLSKLVKLIREPEDLQEDIQTVVELSTEYLKHLPDKTLFEASQRIVGHQTQIATPSS